LPQTHGLDVVPALFYFQEESKMSDQNTPPTGDITSDDKLWALLAYVLSPLIPIIILLMEDGMVQLRAEIG
jgi:hypothetical protein